LGWVGSWDAKISFRPAPYIIFLLPHTIFIRKNGKSGKIEKKNLVKQMLKSVGGASRPDFRSRIHPGKFPRKYLVFSPRPHFSPAHNTRCTRLGPTPHANPNSPVPKHGRTLPRCSLSLKIAACSLSLTQISHVAAPHHQGSQAPGSSPSTARRQD
jgi:hypothetical protein